MAGTAEFSLTDCEGLHTVIQDSILKQNHYAYQSRHDLCFKVGDKILVHRDFTATPVSRYQPHPSLRWHGGLSLLKFFVICDRQSY